MSSQLQKVSGEQLLYFRKDNHGRVWYYMRRRDESGDNDIALKTTKIGQAIRLRDDFLAAKRARKLGIAAPEPNPKDEPLPKATCGIACDRYENDGYPDENGDPHTGEHLHEIKRNINDLRRTFAKVFVEDLTQDLLDEYRKRRKGEVRKGCSGARTVDKELTTLSKVIDWAIRKRVGGLKYNPILNRVKYCTSKTVRHCRDYKPENIEEVHLIASMLFERAQSEGLGWEVIFKSLTGLRGHEIHQWKITDRTDVPGGLTADRGSLCVRRAKVDGVGLDNIYLPTNPALLAAWDAHRIWHKNRYSGSTWFFPGVRSKKGAGNAGKTAIGKAALTRTLRRLFEKKKIHKKVTGHGLRAFYVWVRRSQGLPDEIIAHELNHSSTLMLQRVYGTAPAHWKDPAKRPNLSWAPTGEPSWTKLIGKLTESGLDTPAAEEYRASPDPDGNTAKPKDASLGQVGRSAQSQSQNRKG